MFTEQARPRKSERAHRMSWRLAHGEIPAGLQVLHQCDNPPCVRPEHLFLGTNRDNMQDRARKGHYQYQRESLNNPHRKLSPEDVGHIRAAYSTDKHNGYELAQRFGISDSQVYEIVHYRVWRGV
jgi:hypothetical protein